MGADCSWCGREADPGDSWLLAEPAGDRGAVFCRLEHIIPWTIQGPHWAAGAPPVPGDEPAACARCGEPLPDTRLVLLRRRGAHRISEGFCSLDHLAAWAKSGGPWGA